MGKRAHLIAGGFPTGQTAGHDIDYARLRLLRRLEDRAPVITTVAHDWDRLETWLKDASFLITYLAGPVPDETQHAVLKRWLEAGGRWLGLHGTSGGRAARIEGGPFRRMLKQSHHDTLGCFFLNHPPLRRFEVAVNRQHPLARGLPDSFATEDELYLVEPLGPVEPLLTTQLTKDPSPRGFGFQYEADTSVQEDGRTRILGYTKEVGRGGVAYLSLGHCHDPASNIQPFVDESLGTGGKTPKTFRGSWDVDAFEKLLDNAFDWGLHTEA